jgi:hypothetical protein
MAIVAFFPTALAWLGEINEQKFTLEISIHKIQQH